MDVFIKKVLCVAAVVSAAIVVMSCGGGATATPGESTDGDRRLAQKQAQSRRPDTDAERNTDGEVEKLRDARVSLMGLNIPCGIGEGTAASEAEALRIATEKAREAATASVGFQVHGFVATYANGVPAGSKRAWKERVTQQSVQALAQTPLYKSVVQRNRSDGTFTVTAMIILDPEVFKKALSDATFVNREFQRRAQHESMMAKMDAVIQDFNSKYRR